MLQPQAPGIPVPTPSSTSAPYWDACRRGELVFQRCDRCETIALRPTTVCGNCLGRSLSWVHSSGLGRLYSWTVVWRPQHPSFQVPYAPAIVALDEDWFMMSAVVGCEPEELRADMRVAVEFHPASDEISLPYFRPASAPEPVSRRA
jgi:uncharacterized OB-fold protein